MIDRQTKSYIAHQLTGRPMLYTGIDLHQRPVVFCTVNGSCTVVARRQLKADCAAISEYFAQWAEPHQAAVECTGSWYWLCDLLQSLGIAVILAHVKYLKAVSYAKVKTDAVDAHTLAQLLRMGSSPEAHQLRPVYRAVRDLLRQRTVMEHKRTNFPQRISSSLAQFNIAELPVSPSQSGFADVLKECAIPEQYRITLLMFHQQCLLATEHRKQLEKYFKTRLRPTTTLQRLLSIPGIGDIAGSKERNQFLKYASPEAAIKAIMHYPEIRTFAGRLEHRANKTIARTVVAGELVKIVCYVLAREQSFVVFNGITIAKILTGPVPVSPCAQLETATVLRAFEWPACRQSGIRARCR
jgi:transposase